MPYVTDAMREYLKKQSKNKVCDYGTLVVDVNYYLRHKNEYLLVKPKDGMSFPSDFYIAVRTYKIKGLPLYIVNKDQLQEMKQNAAGDSPRAESWREMLSEFEAKTEEVNDYNFTEEQIKNSKRESFTSMYSKHYKDIFDKLNAKYKEMVKHFVAADKAINELYDLASSIKTPTIAMDMFTYDVGNTYIGNGDSGFSEDDSLNYDDFIDSIKYNDYFYI